MKKLQHFFSSRKSWVLPYLIFSVIFVIIPLLLIVVYAFTDDMGHLTYLISVSFLLIRSLSIHLQYLIGIAILTTLGCNITGLSGSLDSEQQQESELFAYADHAVYPSDVGKHSGIRTLATVALFDFCRLPLGEGALIFGMIYNFIPLLIYPIYNTLAEDGQKLH